jgi:hypothetical protein
MSYVTAVTDRVLSDITTPTSKGHFNVADWTRIYGNAKLVNALTAIMLDTPITFTEVLTVPTTASIPSVTDFNNMLSGIEATRLAVLSLAIAGTSTEIKHNYIAGTGQPTFNYVNVNIWESTLDAIWTHYNGASLDVCPTLAADLTVLTGVTKIIIDCLDTATYNVDLQGTGHLAII